MRDTDEIECAVPWCNTTIYPNDYKVHTETGVCYCHAVCVKCNSKNVKIETKRENPMGAVAATSYPVIKCTSCDHIVPMALFSDMMQEYWATTWGVLHRAGFRWESGAVVSGGAQPALLPFTTIHSDNWGGFVASNMAICMNQVFSEPDIEWIAQDRDYIYVPYRTGDRGLVETKKYLRDVRKYVPGVVVVPVIEVVTDTNSDEYKKWREGIEAISVNGEAKKP